MPTPEEKARRKALRNATREAEMDSIRQGLPLPPAKMKELFHFVDGKLAQSECDHSLSITTAFLDSHQINSQPVLAWLRTAGGYCDCEVIANAEEKFLLAFPAEA